MKTEAEDEIALRLQNGEIVVMPTDTLYGIVASALDPEVVEKLYFIRERNTNKPFIVLISEIADLQKFGIQISEDEKSKLEKIWPGKVSVVLPCVSEKFSYLHRGKKSLAFRLPHDPSLISLLQKTGPLVAPSANTEGNAPAETIEQAQNYFGVNVDLYIDGGKIEAVPSTLIAFEDGKVKVIRQGAVNIQL